MSLHIRIPDYKCKRCNTVFMAYAKGVRCPKCNLPEESNGESYDFVDEVICSMAGHLTKYDRFTPDSWSNSTYCDYMQGLIFSAYDYCRNNSGENKTKYCESVMVDGDGKEFTNTQYFIDLFSLIDSHLKRNPIKELGIISRKLVDFREYLLRKIMP